MRKFLSILLFVSLFYAASALAAVNINTASTDQLTELSGIGQIKAAAIVEDRETNGNFETVDDLTRVSGIGMKTVEKLRDEVSVSAADVDSGSSDME